MKSNLRAEIMSGVLGGFVVLLFGGWSVMVVGVVNGVAMGLTSQQSAKGLSYRQAFLSGARPAAVASIILVLCAFLRNYVLADAAGLAQSPISTVILASLIGAVGMILFAGVFAALDTLSRRNAQIARVVILS